MRDFGESNDWDARGDEKDAVGQIPAFLRDPLGILERRWPVMIAVVVVGLVATVYAVAQAKLTYLSKASVLVTRQQIPEKFVNSTVAEDSIGNINAMVGKVLSQDNLAKLVERFDLFKSSRDLVPMSDLVNRMRASITVAPQRSFTQRRRGGESSVIYGMSFEHRNPEIAADVANALAGLLQEASIERRTEQARAATQFLQRQLEIDEREHREQSQLVSAFRRAHRGTLPDELQTNLRKLELIGTRRESLVAQIASAENRMMTIGSGSNEAQLGELRRQLSRDSAMYTDEHPNILALKFQIKRLEKAIRSSAGAGANGRPEFDGLVHSEQTEISMIKSRLFKIDTEITDLNARIDTTPVVAEELGLLEQKDSVLREDYLSSLRKVEEAELAESMEHAQQGAQVQTIDPAMPPSAPTRSRRFLAFGGLVATLVLAAGMAVTMEIFDPVIVTPDQLEGIVGRPVLGALPRLA